MPAAALAAANSPPRSTEEEQIQTDEAIPPAVEADKDESVTMVQDALPKEPVQPPPSLPKAVLIHDRSLLEPEVDFPQ